MKRWIICLLALFTGWMPASAHPFPTVWAFFYGWYLTAGATGYVSSDPTIMARQMAEAESAGINGFIVSWWGPQDATDDNLSSLLDVAAARHFKIALHLETLANGAPRPAHQLEDWLGYALSHYGRRLYHVRGKPLVVIYAAETVPLASWQSIFRHLRARGLDATYLAMGYDPADLAVFDGLYQYGVFWVSNLAGTEALLSQTAHRAGKLFAATVQPGYDERDIPGRRGDFQPRQDGAYYQSTITAAVDSQPDMIFITTWNEWYEHSAIEPGAPYGDQYLTLTRQFVTALQ